MNIQDKITIAVCALGILLCAVGLVGAWRMSKQHKAQNALAYELPDDTVPPPRNCSDCSAAYSVLNDECTMWRKQAAALKIENYRLNVRLGDLESKVTGLVEVAKEITLHRDALDERLRRVYLDNAGAKQDDGVRGLPCKS